MQFDLSNYVFYKIITKNKCILIPILLEKQGNLSLISLAMFLSTLRAKW